MKRIAACLSIMAVALGLTILPGLAEGKKVTLSGYLLDQMCGQEIKDPAKAKEHTRECALMDHCAASGYGIYVDGKLLKFDKAGSQPARTLLENSKKEKEIEVIAEGTLSGNVLTVTSLKEK